MWQLLNGQEYPVAKGDIIKKGFDLEAIIEWCVAFLHGFSQLPDCPRYTIHIITLRTYLQRLPIYNNDMLVAVKFMVDFQRMHFNAKKNLYINFQKHA